MLKNFYKIRLTKAALHGLFLNMDQLSPVHMIAGRMILILSTQQGQEQTLKGVEVSILLIIVIHRSDTTR